MDKSKEDALRRVIRRILTRVVKETREHNDVKLDNIRVLQTTYELLKEVTIRTKVA